MLTAVVTIVDGEASLERCLIALETQSGVSALEIIVPWDDSVADVPALAARHPRCRFLPLGTIETKRPKAGPAGRHELFDRRRAAGLAAAGGELVAILEDRGVPRPDWAHTMERLHASLAYAVIGGAIENGRRNLLNWAVYFCDFGRYQLPFAAGARPYVSDVNVCYKRRALDLTRDLWTERYHETTVHWALQRAGEKLYLSPEPVVEQHRDGLRLAALVSERLGSGRLFAYTRGRETGRPRRLILAALTSVLPFLLLARQLRDRVRRRRSIGAFLGAAPVCWLLLAAWSAGEALGYLTGEP
jgi:hypothetical protein